MKLIIDIPDELFNIFKKHRIMAFDYFNEYDKDTIAVIIANGTPYNPKGDCISHEAVRSKIWKERVDKDEGCNSEYIRGLKTAIGFINNAQAVDRPQGEWINHRNDYGHNIADCSLCGKTMQWHDEDGDGIPRYCWYCGASMKGGAE